MISKGQECIRTGQLRRIQQSSDMGRSATGRQAQINWEVRHHLNHQSRLHKAAVFVIILGYSRVKCKPLWHAQHGALYAERISVLLEEFLELCSQTTR